MGGRPPAITSNQNNFLGPVAACCSLLGPWGVGGGVFAVGRALERPGAWPVGLLPKISAGKYAPEDVFQYTHFVTGIAILWLYTTFLPRL